MATGKRIEKYFDTFAEARNWLEDARHDDRHGHFAVYSDMTVDEWFDIWINNLVIGVRDLLKRSKATKPFRWLPVRFKAGCSKVLQRLLGETLVNQNDYGQIRSCYRRFPAFSRTSI